MFTYKANKRGFFGGVLYEPGSNHEFVVVGKKLDPKPSWLDLQVLSKEDAAAAAEAKKVATAAKAAATKAKKKAEKEAEESGKSDIAAAAKEQEANAKKVAEAAKDKEKLATPTGDKTEAEFL